VLESSGVLWVIPYPSGPPRRVRSGLISLGGGWFSDSRRIAVSGRPNGFSALAVVDTADGSLRTLYSSTDPVLTPSVSGDGKRIAFASGKTEWDVLEIAVPSGGIRALVSGGGIAMLPDWAPSGTHFVFASNHGGPYGLEDQSAAEAFSRKLLQAPPGQQFNQAHWSPDGSRLVFVKGPTGPYPGQLMLANAAGGGVVAVKGEQDRVYGPSWSPDGQWVLYIREHNGARQLAKIMPGSGGPVVLENAQPINDPLELGSPYSSWSPTGEWLVLANPQGLALISPDGRSIRQLSRRRISPFGFTRDGRQVLGIYRNPSLSGPEWQLISLDVATGSEKFLAPLNLPGSVDGLSGFSLHPDGKRLLVSAAKWPYEIWMLEGFDQAPPRNWLDRIFSR
jgi:Tol biopolymer transport system component